MATVEQNIEDREWFDMMVAERGERFWQLCHEKLFPDVMDGIDESLMDRAEVKRFENSMMKFGQYSGQPIGNIPIDYLEFLANTIGWVRKLNQYLKTKEHRN